MEKRKILIISSISPYKSANLGMDVKASLEMGGYEVDFLTQHPIPSLDLISIDDTVEPDVASNEPKRKSLLKRLFSFSLFKKKRQPKSETNQFVIIHSDEAHPPVKAELITNKINKTYHFSIILFWQGMLTSNSLMHIYNKMKVPLFIMAVDMYPFTGGCFYFWNCRNFIHTSCGTCPGLNSTDKNDETKTNFIYKQQVYKNIKCIFLGNKWMRSYIEKTPIIADSPIMDILLVVNETTFKIRDKESVYEEFSLEPQKGQFIIFAGAPNLNEKRKGFIYLVQCINLFVEKLSDKERSKIILLLAGNTAQDIKSHFNIKVHELGFLDCKKLAKAYNLADVYLSPSIEDAGPSMINQSIMAGTPVVAFNIGVAQSLVITGKTGYRAKTLCAEDLAKGIDYIYSLSEEERYTIQQNCREMGINTFSYAAFADKIKQYDKTFCT